MKIRRHILAQRLSSSRYCPSKHALVPVFHLHLETSPCWTAVYLFSVAATVQQDPLRIHKRVRDIEIWARDTMSKAHHRERGINLKITGWDCSSFSNATFSSTPFMSNTRFFRETLRKIRFHPIPWLTLVGECSERLGRVLIMTSASCFVTQARIFDNSHQNRSVPESQSRRRSLEAR